MIIPLFICTKAEQLEDEIKRVTLDQEPWGMTGCTLDFEFY